MGLPEAKTGAYYLCPGVSSWLTQNCRYDNSGHRMSYPTWQSDQTNIARTDAIIQQIASMFADQVDVVPIIAPLNE